MREYILAGGTLPLEVYVGRGDEPLGVMPIMHPDYLEYDRVIGYYQGLYGNENVLVMPMEMLKARPSRIRPEIARILPIPWPDRNPALAETRGDVGLRPRLAAAT